MHNNNRLWILGAADSEMAAIEQLLTECGEKFAYATLGRSRIHAGNAYRADCWITPEGMVYDAAGGVQLVFVECSVDLRADHEPPVIVIDHHRPGDPGFGKPPEEFLVGSSIGQVINLLGQHVDFPPEWTRVAVPRHPHWCGSIENFDGVWVVRTTTAEGDPGQMDSEATAAVLPVNLGLIAAADHCLAAAYAGKCPGVDPQQLFNFRVEQKAKFQKRPEADVLLDIASTTAVIKSRAVQNCSCGQYNPPGCPYCIECNQDVDYHSCLAFIDMTDASHPELPEAACRLGVSYLASVTEPTGRRKTVVGGCATDNDIANWMIGEKKLGKEVYGDPVRGYAGSYDLVTE